MTRPSGREAYALGRPHRQASGNPTTSPIWIGDVTGGGPTTVPEDIPHIRTRSVGVLGGTAHTSVNCVTPPLL